MNYRYAAGLAEGYLTRDLIYYFWQNVIEVYIIHDLFKTLKQVIYVECRLSYISKSNQYIFLYKYILLKFIHALVFFSLLGFRIIVRAKKKFASLSISLLFKTKNGLKRVFHN